MTKKAPRVFCQDNVKKKILLMVKQQTNAQYGPFHLLQGS